MPYALQIRTNYNFGSNKNSNPMEDLLSKPLSKHFHNLSSKWPHSDPLASLRANSPLRTRHSPVQCPTRTPLSSSQSPGGTKERAQMIALVLAQEASPLNVFSILLSMISVASKALMFSYSIHRSTFFFNFLCFSADIFGIFTTLSWVFYHPHYTGQISILGWVWIYKIICVAGACVAGGILLVLWHFPPPS